MPDLGSLDDLTSADLERGIETPPFRGIRQRKDREVRRRRRRTRLCALTGALILVAAAGTAVSAVRSRHTLPASIVAGPTPGPAAQPSRPDGNLSGVVWLRVVLDPTGGGFAIGADCGAARTFCRYVVRHTSDGATSWQSVPAPSAFLINPGRFLADLDAATGGGRLWFQSDSGFSGVQTGTASGGWQQLVARTGRFEESDVLGGAVVVDDYAPAGRGHCGLGVALLTATGVTALAHQPRESYGTEQTRVAADGSLWQLSPAYPATGCTLKLGTEVHGKVLSIASDTGAAWSVERPVPDLTTQDFAAFSARQAVGLLTLKDIRDADVPNALALLSTSDGGHSWSRRQLPVTAVFARENGDGILHAFSADDLMVTTLTSVAASNDGGRSFHDVLTPRGSDQVASVSVLSATVGLIVTEQGRLLRTVDAGATWTQLPSL